MGELTLPVAVRSLPEAENTLRVYLMTLSLFPQSHALAENINSGRANELMHRHFGFIFSLQPCISGLLSSSSVVCRGSPFE